MPTVLFLRDFISYSRVFIFCVVVFSVFYVGYRDKIQYASSVATYKHNIEYCHSNVNVLYLEVGNVYGPGLKNKT